MSPPKPVPANLQWLTEARPNREVPLVLLADGSGTGTSQPGSCSDADPNGDPHATEAVTPTLRAATHDLAALAWRIAGAEAHTGRFCLRHDAKGRPIVPSPWHISMSHARESRAYPALRAVALACLGPIGIDVERPRILQMPAAWQARFAAHGEADAVLGWTAAEALGKALGMGVGPVLTMLRTFTPATHRSAGAPDPVQACLDRHNLKIIHLACGPTRRATVVVPKATDHVACAILVDATQS